MMGTLRKSNHNPKCPSTMFGFDDWPANAKILLNDICEVIVIGHDTQGFSETLSYDEYDRLSESGRRGARAGRKLKHEKRC